MEKRKLRNEMEVGVAKLKKLLLGAKKSLKAINTQFLTNEDSSKNIFWLLKILESPNKDVLMSKYNKLKEEYTINLKMLNSAFGVISYLQTELAKEGELDNTSTDDDKSHKKNQKAPAGFTPREVFTSATGIHSSLGAECGRLYDKFFKLKNEIDSDGRKHAILKEIKLDAIQKKKRDKLFQESFKKIKIDKEVLLQLFDEYETFISTEAKEPGITRAGLREKGVKAFFDSELQESHDLFTMYTYFIKAAVDKAMDKDEDDLFENFIFPFMYASCFYHGGHKIFDLLITYNKGIVSYTDFITVPLFNKETKSKSYMGFIAEKLYEDEKTVKFIDKLYDYCGAHDDKDCENSLKKMVSYLVGHSRYLPNDDYKQEVNHFFTTLGTWFARKIGQLDREWGHRTRKSLGGLITENITVYGPRDLDKNYNEIPYIKINLDDLHNNQYIKHPHIQRFGDLGRYAYKHNIDYIIEEASIEFVTELVALVPFGKIFGKGVGLAIKYLKNVYDLYKSAEKVYNNLQKDDFKRISFEYKYENGKKTGEAIGYLINLKKLGIIQVILIDKSLKKGIMVNLPMTIRYREGGFNILGAINYEAQSFYASSNFERHLESAINYFRRFEKEGFTERQMIKNAIEIPERLYTKMIIFSTKEQKKKVVPPKKKKVRKPLRERKILNGYKCVYYLRFFNYDGRGYQVLNEFEVTRYGKTCKKDACNEAERLCKHAIKYVNKYKAQCMGLGHRDNEKRCYCDYVSQYNEEYYRYEYY